MIKCMCVYLCVISAKYGTGLLCIPNSENNQNTSAPTVVKGQTCTAYIILTGQPTT